MQHFGHKIRKKYFRKNLIATDCRAKYFSRSSTRRRGKRWYKTASLKIIWTVACISLKLSPGSPLDKIRNTSVVDIVYFITWFNWILQTRLQFLKTSPEWKNGSTIHKTHDVVSTSMRRLYNVGDFVETSYWRLNDVVCLLETQLNLSRKLTCSSYQLYYITVVEQRHI